MHFAVNKMEKQKLLQAMKESAIRKKNERVDTSDEWVDHSDIEECD